MKTALLLPQHITCPCLGEIATSVFAIHKYYLAMTDNGVVIVIARLCEAISRNE